MEVVPGGISVADLMSTAEEFRDFATVQSAATVRAAVDSEMLFGDAKVAAMAWLYEHEALEREAQFNETLAISRQSADVAARSARWTMVAAIAAGLGAMAAAVGAIVTAVSVWPGH